MQSAAESQNAPPGRGADIRRGVRDIVPIMAATAPFAVIFGALAAQRGLTFPESAALSGLVYAGASQFVALEFWADPLPYWTILASVLAVNLRHILYSAAFGRKIGHWPAVRRYLGFALLVDPTFALAELDRSPRLSAAYYFGLAVPLYVFWLTTTSAGYVFGNLLGAPERFGLDFLVTAYFIVLVVGFRKRPNSAAVIAASASAAVITYLTLGSPWHFATGAIAGVLVAAGLAKPPSPDRAPERAPESPA